MIPIHAKATFIYFAGLPSRAAQHFVIGSTTFIGLVPKMKPQSEQTNHMRTPQTKQIRPRERYNSHPPQLSNMP